MTRMALQQIPYQGDDEPKNLKPSKMDECNCPLPTNGGIKHPSEEGQGLEELSLWTEALVGTIVSFFCCAQVGTKSVPLH